MENTTPSQNTQELLISALERLIARKSFDDISVSELTKVAGISRMTFYRHYHNSIDVLDHEVRNLMNEFNQTIKYVGDNYAYILQVIHFFQKYQNVVMLLLQAHQQELLYQNVSIVMEQLALSNNYLDGLSQQDANYYVKYHSTGLIGVILKWMSDKQSESPEYLAIFLDRNSR